MHIEHIAMYVSDLEGARDFFIRYFHAASNSGYHNKTTGFRSYFLTFDSGARLELMHRADIAAREQPLAQTGYAHMAFSLGSEEAVRQLTDQLRHDGYSVLSGPRTTGDGYYESCILGYEGHLIELTV